MNKEALKKGLGYTSFTFFALGLSLYMTFPTKAVGQRVSHEVNQRLGKSMKVSFDEVGLNGLTGISADGVELTLMNQTPPVKVQVDSIEASVELLALAAGDLTVAVMAGLGDGTIEAAVTPGQKAGEMSVQAELDQVNLLSPPIVSQLAGLPVQGVVSGKVNVDWKNDARKATGEVELKAEGAGVGPGEVVGFSLPNLGLGNVELALSMKSGTLKVDSFEQTGGDIQADIEGDFSVRSRVASTSMNACVKLKGDPDYRDKQPKLKTALELATVKLKKDGDDFLHIPLAGTVGRPRMRGGLCRQGKSRGGSKRGGR